MNKKQQISIIIGILLLTILFAFIFYLAKPEVQMTDTGIRPLLVEVIKAEPEDKEIILSAYGTVEPYKKVTLHPEVSGTVIEISDNFEVGDILKEGEKILQINPKDFELAVQQAEAEVTKAEFELKVEEGKQIVAQREWELLNPTIKELNIGEDLALRKPHLEEKKAALESAISKLEKAKLNLSRTNVAAPFFSIVLEESAEVGQYLTPQTSIGTLVGAEQFRVRVSMPYEELRWIRPVKEGEVGPKIVIIQEYGNNQEIEREGRIGQLLSDVDPTGRLARLMVYIEDPLGIMSETYRSKPFLIGTYVRVLIYGPTLENVYLLPREAIREGSTVWIKNSEDELEIREIKILYREENNVIINEGLSPGDEVIVSPLSLVVPGTKLRTSGEDIE